MSGDLWVAFDPSKEPGNRLAPEVNEEIRVVAEDGVDSVVGSADIEDGAVTTPKIADLAVTAPKLASNAVTTSKIAGNSISSDKLGPGAVTPAKVGAGVVTSHNIDGGDLRMDVVPVTAEQYAAIPNPDVNTLYLITDGNSSVEVPGGGGGGGTGGTGPQGPAGPAGPTGPAGADGAPGPAGPEGPQGQQGIQGAPGLGIRFVGEVASVAELPATGNVQGDLYVLGNRDDDTLPAESYIWDETQADWLYGGRIQGPQGVEGPAGAQGPKGDPGADGAPGVDGATGAQGPAGDKGDQGDTGAQGPAGADGAKGDPGADGAPGATGPAGPSAVSADADNATTLGTDGLVYTPLGGGAVGPQGPAGPKGDAGPAGADGATGPEGPAGPAGADGADGADGQQGIQGAPGLGIRYVGEVATVAELPATGNVQGDLWVIGNRDDDTQPAESYIWDEGQADWIYGGRIQGPQGVPGVAGPKGDPGADGAVGPAGADGAVGPAGADGAPGADGATGPAGPSAVSADAGNASVLGTDGLIWTPAGGGGGLVTAPSVAEFPAAGESGKVYLAEDSGDTFRFDATAKGTDTYVRISETTVAAKIEDSTVVGRAVVVAVDEAAGRAALGAEDAALKGQPDGYAPLGADGVVPLEHLPARTSINLRDFPEVLAANWETFLGAQFTVGGTEIRNTPWTADDVGKIAMVLTNNAVSPPQWWKSEILSVAAGGVATVSTAAPAVGGVENAGARVRYGFDGTTAINAALAAVNDPDGPVDVYLGGNYRLTQLVIPPNVRLHGVSWTPTTVQQVANASMTALAQLPGAQKDFVIFKESPTLPGTIAFSGLIDLELMGPELNVAGLPAATIGNGVSFRVDGSTYGLVIDGFEIRNVTATNFPESGFRTFGVVPMYVNECKALYNGRFGWEHVREGGASTNALHFFNFSADWNNLGAIGFKLLQANDTVFITGLKSEGHVAGAEANATRGGPNFQSECLVFENCDSTPVMVNGVSHIRIDRAKTAPGAAITIKDSGGPSLTARRPRLSYNAVAVRLTGSETGDVTGARTINDLTFPTAADGQVSRASASGYWPGLTAPPYLLDKNGNRMMQFVPLANATAYFQMYNVPTGAPVQISAVDSTQANVGMALVPKGTGSVQIGGSAPRISATGTNSNLNLQGSGTGQVQIVGYPAASKVPVPADLLQAGKPGQFAADSTGMTVYTGDGTTHAWSGVVTGVTYANPAHTGKPLSLWSGTKSQYDSIPVKSQTCIYVVTAVTAVTGDITVDEGAQTGDIAAEPVADEPVTRSATTKSTRKK